MLISLDCRLIEVRKYKSLQQKNMLQDTTDKTDLLNTEFYHEPSKDHAYLQNLRLESSAGMHECNTSKV